MPTSWPRMRPVWLAATTLSLALAGASAGAAPAWPQYGFDAGQSWFNPQEKTLKAGNVKRLVLVSQQRLGQFYAGPTTQSKGVLFVCSNLSGLSAIELLSNSTQWSRFGLGGNCGAAALDGQTAYVSASSLNTGNWTNTLSAVARDNGANRWQALGPPDEPFPAASYLGFNNPTLWQGGLYVSHGRSLVSAYDAASGNLRWRAATGRLNNQVSVGAGRVFTSTWGGEVPGEPNQLLAHDTVDGTLAWSQPMDFSNSQYPAAVSAGRVFAGTDNGLVKAFDAHSGSLLWQQTLSGYVSAPLAAAPELLFVNHGSSRLSALRTANGQLQWSITLAGSDTVASNLVLANQLLFAMTRDFSGSNRLSVFNALTGQRVARLAATVPGSYASLSVAGGQVFVTDSSGYLSILALP